MIIDLGEKSGNSRAVLSLAFGHCGTKETVLPCVGVITRRVPPTHVPLYKLIFSPREAVQQFRKWKSWL